MRAAPPMPQATQTRTQFQRITAAVQGGEAQHASNASRIAALEIRGAVVDERVSRLAEDVRDVKAIVTEIRDRMPPAQPLVKAG